MGKNESNVIPEQDPFGTVRFDAIKARFGDTSKLDKLFKGRFQNIVSIFSYRTSVAHELHHAREMLSPQRRVIEERLAKLKSAEFFCDALRALLDEKLKHDMLKPAKKSRYSGGW